MVVVVKIIIAAAIVMVLVVKVLYSKLTSRDRNVSTSGATQRLRGKQALKQTLRDRLAAANALNSNTSK